MSHINRSPEDCIEWEQLQNEEHDIINNLNNKMKKIINDLKEYEQFYSQNLEWHDAVIQCKRRLIIAINIILNKMETETSIDSNNNESEYIYENYSDYKAYKKWLKGKIFYEYNQTKHKIVNGKTVK